MKEVFCILKPYIVLSAMFDLYHIYHVQYAKAAAKRGRTASQTTQGSDTGHKLAFFKRIKGRIR